MRTTLFELHSGTVVTDVRDEPKWQPFEEYDGQPLERVRVHDVIEPPRALVQLVELAAGGSFAMHSSPDVAFCQVVRGRGKLGLPDGRELE
jgi:quercetin dioxygenase-like cupin family protein